MGIDSNLALRQLISALENFHAAVVEFSDPDATAVLRATDYLADAYTIYDDAIFTQFGVEAPFDTFVEDDELEDDEYDSGEDFLLSAESAYSADEDDFDDEDFAEEEAEYYIGDDELDDFFTEED
ncbi:MAG: hypothetical protein SPG61_03370 [Arcanobacterium sp.]|nr:hypothetical protein [Arcanobacterium sp.]